MESLKQRVLEKCSDYIGDGVIVGEYMVGLQDDNTGITTTAVLNCNPEELKNELDLANADSFGVSYDPLIEAMWEEKQVELDLNGKGPKSFKVLSLAASDKYLDTEIIKSRYY